MLVLAISFPIEAQSSDLGESAKVRFEKASKALDDIEKAEGGAAAAGEIAVARKWIEDGKRLLESGKIKRAVQIAERLPFELDLIRLLVATGLAVEEARQMEQQVFWLEQGLKILKAKRDRLLLEKNGARISDAFPRLDEAAK
jgi:hypothetical protein